MTTFLVPDHVMLRSVGEELVLLNLETERYFGLDEIGAAMVNALKRGDSLEEAARALADDFDAPVETIQRDLEALTEKLVDAGLLQAA